MSKELFIKIMLLIQKQTSIDNHRADLLEQAFGKDDNYIIIMTMLAEELLKEFIQLLDIDDDDNAVDMLYALAYDEKYTEEYLSRFYDTAMGKEPLIWEQIVQ